MSTDRLLTKFVLPAEPFEGSDYDTIDLTPAQGRKGSGMSWAELGEPISTEGDWSSGAGQDSSYDDLMAAPDAKESELASDPAADEGQSDDLYETSQEIGPQLQDIYATDESELVEGTVLHDRILAGAGDDTIHGGGGQDEIWGGDGNDIIYGNWLEMFDGGIIMQNGAFGGAGDDILVHGGGFQGFDGGDGYDVISLTEPSSDYVIRHYSGDGLYDQGFNYTIVFSQPNGIDIHVDLRNVEAIMFGNGVTFELETGTGEIETHFVVMNDGTAETIFAGSPDLSQDATGNDWLAGTAGSDWIDPGAGDDYVTADAGDDVVIASEGFDSLDGGDGYDTLVLTGTWSDYRFDYTDSRSMMLWDQRHPTAGPNDGWDTFADFEAIQFADQTLSWAEFIAHGNQIVTGEGLLKGSFGNDTISGGDDSDYVLAGSGSNVISTFDGSDSIIAQEARPGVWTKNIVDAGGGNDTVWLGGQQENSEVTGGAGDDWLSAAQGTTYAIYRGAASDYKIQLISTITLDDGSLRHTYQVEDSVSGRDGKDAIEGNFILKFADGTLNVSDGIFDLLT